MIREPLPGGFSMRRFLLPLGVCFLLIFSLSLFSAIKNPCCPTHFEIVKAYQDSMQSLVEKVKAESVDDFEKRFHDKEALTYLDLLHGVLTEVDAHYKELGATQNVAEDEGLVRSGLEKLDRWIKQLKATKGAEAKKIVESYDLQF